MRVMSSIFEQHACNIRQLIVSGGAVRSAMRGAITGEIDGRDSALRALCSISVLVNNARDSPRDGSV